MEYFDYYEFDGKKIPLTGNFKLIMEKFSELKGQFVITESFNIERLVAIGDDGEDWYYITFDGKDLSWQSCVGRIIPLKGYLKDEDYDYLIYSAKLNHYDQVDSQMNEIFLKTIENYISAYKNDRIITEFCWDLL